jgi:8-oxo-dGTP pyrophosphatase MutT (NUDIX family)
MTESAKSDAAQVPVRPAATLILLSDRPDLQVLLLRRRAASAFVPGMVVFPGGALDEADGSPEAAALCRGLDDCEAGVRLGVEGGGLAYWVAAIRETFEEAGVLLATHRDRQVDLSKPARAERFAALRAEVDAGHLDLAKAMDREGLRLSTDAIYYAARWITPVGPPRRYDTRFFVAAQPPGQEALHDDREAVHSEWIRPAEALERFEAGELSMLPPTAGMLRLLTRFRGAREAVEAAARHQHGPDVPVRLASDGERWRVLLPEDPGYAEGSMPIRAWVRFGVEDVDAAQGVAGGSS